MQSSKPKTGDTIAVIESNKGTMKAVLFEKKVPETVKNFKFHADKGNYDNTIFHRVIEDFMVQGGDFQNKNGTGGYSYKGPGTSFNDEFDPDLKNIKGALSMANRGANTNGSQFFIVHAKSTPWLDGKHAVFGQLYEGFDVLDEIATSEVGPMDNPLVPIVVTKITVEKY